MAGEQYTITVNAKLNTAQIQKQLNQLGKGGALDLGTDKTQKGIDGVGKSIDGASKKIKGMNTGLMGSVKHFGQIIGKVALFSAATAVLSTVTAGIGDMVRNVYDLDTSLTELKKVSSLSGDGLKQFTEEAYEAGSAVARTGREMIDSATLFKKSGFGEEQSLQLATVSEKFRNIADAELTSAEASKFLISQMKAFNIEASDAETIIDSVNEVSNNFAVGSNDLQMALSKTGSAMATTGNTYAETIGIITAGAEVLPNQAGKVARGWRTIAVNIANLAQSQDKWVGANGKVQVALKDQDGNLKSTYQILDDLYPQWKKLGDSEKTQLATSVAGKMILARIGLIAGSIIYKKITDIKNICLKILIPNYNSNIICGEFNTFGMVII